MKLLLVRHGATEYNASRRFSGHGDIDLSEAGYRQAHGLERRLAGEKITAVYTSDLKRARRTAEAIAGVRDLETVFCPEIREINYGDAEGLTFREISERYPVVAERCVRFSPELEFPGGESFADFAGRVIGFLGKLEGRDDADTILIVSHGGPLRTIICHLLGLEQSQWWQFRLDNASLTIVETYPRGAILSLLNDTAHCEEE